MAAYPPAVILIAAIAWSIWALAHNFRRGWVARKQAEVHLHLLDRLGTGLKHCNICKVPQVGNYSKPSAWNARTFCPASWGPFRQASFVLLGFGADDPAMVCSRWR